MPEFAYVAVGPDGQRVEGRAVAANEAALAQLLRRQEQFLVQAGAPEEDTVDFSQIRVLERVTRRDVIFFTTQMATIAATGVNLVDGLRDLETQVVKTPVRRMIADVRRGIESGKSLSAAMETHPEAFDDLYTSIVRAGEATGRLDRAFEDLARQLEWQDQLTSRVREAATYPTMILVLMTVVISVLVFFTIPRFTQVYQAVNVNLQLPLPTRLVQGFALFMTQNWFIVVAGVAVVFLLYRLRVQEPDGLVWRDGWILRLPIVGDISRKLSLSRFAHFFGTLHESGLDVVPSLALVEKVIGNAAIARRFRAAIARVLSGESLSRALATVGEFSPLVIQMVALGEKTGEMSKALEQVRHYYDREVDKSVNRALTLFGPITIALLAGVFVIIAVAFYLPLFNLARAVNITGR